MRLYPRISMLTVITPLSMLFAAGYRRLQLRTKRRSRVAVFYRSLNVSFHPDPFVKLAVHSRGCHALCRSFSEDLLCARQAHCLPAAHNLRGARSANPLSCRAEAPSGQPYLPHQHSSSGKSCDFVPNVLTCRPVDRQPAEGKREGSQHVPR